MIISNKKQIYSNHIINNNNDFCNKIILRTIFNYLHHFLIIFKKFLALNNNKIYKF